jgi:type I restriction enzyme R subunit
VRRVIDQLDTYKQEIPTLFTHNALLVISDGFTAHAGSLSAGYTRFSAWSCDNQNKRRPAFGLAGD